MRTLLLWMARNAWLKSRLPKMRFVRRAVRRFMPGEDTDAAFAAAAPLAASGQGILFTRLGENLTTLEEADEVAAHYRRCWTRSATLPRPVEISIKPTQLGLDIDRAVCLRHLEALAARCEEIGTWLWLDMEGSAYVEPTLALYEVLKANHRTVGIALQAYLHRTPADLRRLLPLEPAVRLVKGAYDEPATLAYRKKHEVDSAYQSLALILAESARDSRTRCALGTHDSDLVERIATSPMRPACRATGSRSTCSTGSGPMSCAGSRPPGSRPSRSSRTASTGTRGTCAASPSGQPTSYSRSARCCPRVSRPPRSRVCGGR